MGIFTRERATQGQTPDINALLGNVLDRSRDGLYDRVRLRAGAATPREITCFRVGVGGDRTWADTNLTGAGSQLMPPLDLIVQRFLLVFQPSGLNKDRLALLKNYIWEFWILEKCFIRIPLLEFAVKGNIGDVIRDFGTEECRGTLERIARSYCYALAECSKYIPPLTLFKVAIVGEPVLLHEDMDFYAILDGYIDRPVQ